MGHSSSDFVEWEERQKAEKEALALLQSQDKHKREVLDALKKNTPALKALLFDVILERHPNILNDILKEVSNNE